jgi:hypothetical protein
VGNLAAGRTGTGHGQQGAEFFFGDPRGQDLFPLLAEVDEALPQVDELLAVKSSRPAQQAPMQPVFRIVFADPAPRSVAVTELTIC